jgi:antitoxin PrlF
MEKIEDLVKMSTKGQVVIPKEIRDRLNLVPGEKMLIITRNDEIILKRIGKPTVEEIAKRLERTFKREKVNVDKLISEAIKWARSK